MALIVGIDEAGYGPNLGPLVMTSVSCRVPDSLAGANLWRVLGDVVRRRPSPGDARLFIHDSKIVYTTARGLGELERGVLAALAPWLFDREIELAHYIDRISPSCHAELRAEPWYSGRSLLPAVIDRGIGQEASQRFHRSCAKKCIQWGPTTSVVLCPARFNALLDGWRSKGVILGQILASLLQNFHSVGSQAEAMTICIDKHGGRNTYAALLQHAFSDSMVIAHEESSQRSVYRVLGLKREVYLVFQPRADSQHFCVALASMASKYLRELLMREFNAFWQAHVSGLKPTAGYPVDAARFLMDIRPAMERLGISMNAVWRRR